VNESVRIRTYVRTLHTALSFPFPEGNTYYFMTFYQSKCV